MAKLYRLLKQGDVKCMEWHDAFPFLMEKGHVVSVVGGGGKSSLIYAMAELVSGAGRRVLVSTTTHMYRPKSGWSDCVEDAERFWAQGQYAVAGCPSEQGKIAAPEEELFQELRRRADIVLVESDGARGRFCKVPRVFEPVIREESDIVIAVMGMSVLGRTIAESCFCPELVAGFLNKPQEHVLCEENLVRILASPAGSRKAVGERAYWVMLNQCDDERILLRAKRIAELLQEEGITQTVMGRLFDNRDHCIVCRGAVRSEENE